jgi:dolichol-phosphate mannosyltransferase
VLNVAFKLVLEITRHIIRIVDGIINFSYRPLEIVGAFGFLVAIFSFLGIVFFLLHRILDFIIFGYSAEDVPGFTSLILAVLFIGGVQLFTLGLFGEYIGRIFDEIKQRPHYIVQEQTCIADSRTRLPGDEA